MRISNGTLRSTEQPSRFTFLCTTAITRESSMLSSLYFAKKRLMMITSSVLQFLFTSPCHRNTSSKWYLTGGCIVKRSFRSRSSIWFCQTNSQHPPPLKAFTQKPCETWDSPKSKACWNKMVRLSSTPFNPKSSKRYTRVGTAFLLARLQAPIYSQ